MSKSPWSAYGRLPANPGRQQTQAQDLTARALESFERDRQGLQEYLHRALQEYKDIRSRGYKQIIDDALSPSPQPETIEERLRRLERRAQRRGGSQQS